MVWWLQDDARLTTEREAIKELDAKAPWLKGPTWALSGSNLTVQADIQVGDVDYEVVLEYPSLFPAAPPTVSPKDPGQRWSGHQYLGGSGELCLEWGPDNWEPGITGADLLESAYKLLSTEKGDSEDQLRVVASRHQESLGQSLRHESWRVAITPEFEEFISDLPPGTVGTLDMRFVRRDGNSTLHVRSARRASQEPWTAPALPKTLDLTAGFSLTARFVRTDLPRDSYAGVSLSTLREELRECGCLDALEPAEESGITILFLRNSAHGVHALWLAGKEDDRVAELATFRIPTEPLRTGDGAEVVSRKRVGVVGLGSAGSKIALSLARSGVRDFLLVDDDIVLPGNLERHTLDYRNVGEHKVDGVKAQLEALASDMTVQVARSRLSGQEASSTVSYLLGQLSDCDVVVDATANPRTFNELAETVRQAKTPMVWLQVFGGGIGGFVARFRPGKDPDPFTARARFHSYLEDKEPAPGTPAEPYAAEAADRQPLIATDADVAVIAHHAARLAIDILEEHEPSTFPKSLYVIGLERGWLFEEPFHTIGLDIGAPTEVPAEKAESLSQDNIDFLGEVIKRGAGGSSD